MEIITPTEFVGTLMELAQQRRGEFVDMTYLTETRTTLVYNLPLAEVRSFSSAASAAQTSLRCRRGFWWRWCTGGQVSPCVCLCVKDGPAAARLKKHHQQSWSFCSASRCA